MKALFLILPEKGHINPYIGPAQALRQLQWEVIISAPGDISGQIEKAGLTFHKGLIGKEQVQPMKGKELVQLVNNSQAMKEWIRSLLLNVSDLPKVKSILTEVRPDVVVVDPLYYAAVIAVEQLALPWVSMSNSLNPILEKEVKSPLLDMLEELSNARDELFKTHGVRVEFNGCDALSKHLTIAFCTENFVGKRSGVQLVGPSLPLEARGDETSVVHKKQKRTIYVSFGSQIYHWPEIFQKISDATEGLEVQVIMSVGNLKDSLHVHRNITLYSYAPQIEILPATDLFITHGGANSVMEAIALGVKRLWISPMCNDQYHQSYYIEKSGIGKTYDLQQMSTEEIREKISEFLSDSEMALRMKAVAHSYQQNGAMVSAELIRQIL